MKNILFLFLVLGTTNLKAQKESPTVNEKPIVIRCGSITENQEPLYIVDGLPLTSNEVLKNISPEDIISINILKNTEMTIGCYDTAGKNGVVLIQTKKSEIKKCKLKIYPFKVYCIPNTNWVLQQDMYNALEARVPALRVQNRNLAISNPSIRLRGSNIDVVIVDGVRYDASILNSLNPNDIESIRVAPSVAATNYFMNTNTFN